ncbi:acyl-CoA dehydrogenase family protein [Rhodococcus sp. BP-149]|uniref:acyl-CoA dehydrogenase family protein n=1 Tax=unclassified Rhodococcus (in: high G+C Gram-positive bacteria) TaxID=192944 RepID=UPI001C9ADF39|nr:MULTISPECIES: acyl-CoA dehydrogenase family protein [unclassified Rhodococcus (in: high G+C Gram-positive bacteria)]MBY6685658.1 acyl-CoA dehydrogenase family protein [Rhodococcus sp. BP-288]MBY6694794.1 acyl-CoA dehydrogenase family protein [Rhodococcus sp. BP-188]MBY6696640.1 acyl-CoA dehydrogenase family protein [Rhodococcus sp. BP-285]MBY6703296.1 acyl-CoA dehydrogenase family protein [Rhodococcus sp. BP-283]MBY6710750.1 acyl-CoA dehydrogenase family protein [Rhodococcus sp. BP-160]
MTITIDDTHSEATAHEGITDVAERIARAAHGMADRIDGDRRLPADLIDALTSSGLLNACTPADLGGMELPPGEAFRCSEALARGDAATGWCTSIAITSGLPVAFLPEATRNDLFGGGHTVAGGVWAPRGTARRAPGGLVVSGRWPFCSGVTHSDVLFLGCLLDGEHRILAVPTSDLTVLDTWHTLGLRGTGSHDTVADEVFVPEERVFTLAGGPLIDRPLFRFPPLGFFALCIAAAAMGNARAAIDDLVELAAGKRSGGSRRTLAERAATQGAVATAEAALEGARAFYYQSIDEAWQYCLGDVPVPVDARNKLRLAATHGARTSTTIVGSMYDLGGGSAIYDDSPLQRRFRDAFTASAHFQVNEASRELNGRVLLGLPTDTTQL